MEEKNTAQTAKFGPFTQEIYDHIEDYFPIVYAVVEKFRESMYRFGVETEDLVAYGKVALCNAAVHFDPAANLEKKLAKAAEATEAANAVGTNANFQNQTVYESQEFAKLDTELEGTGEFLPDDIVKACEGNRMPQDGMELNNVPIAAKFTTYAYQSIEQELLYRYRQAKNRYYSEGTEIGECKFVSLDAPIETEENAISMHEMVASSADVESEVVTNDIWNNFKKILTQQEYRCARMLEAGLRQEDIAEKLGITQPRVSQMKASIWKKLNAYNAA